MQVMPECGATLSSFCRYMECVLFANGAGPTSWRANTLNQHPGLEQCSELCGSPGGPTLEEIRAAGAHDGIAMAGPDLGLVICWNGNDFDNMKDNVVTQNRWREICKRFAGLTSYFQYVAVLDSDDHVQWEMDKKFSEYMKTCITYLCSLGVHCINIDRHYHTLRSWGGKKNSWHFPTTESVKDACA